MNLRDKNGNFVLSGPPNLVEDVWFAVCSNSLHYIVSDVKITVMDFVSRVVEVNVKIPIGEECFAYRFKNYY